MISPEISRPRVRRQRRDNCFDQPERGGVRPFGTTYGGNGIINFALPNLQGQAIIGSSPSVPLGVPTGSQSSLSHPRKFHQAVISPLTTCNRPCLSRL